MDNVGVFLWANRAQYAEVSFQSISNDDIVDVGLPTMQEDVNEDGLFIPPFSCLFRPQRFLSQRFLCFGFGNGS